jgi:sigma-B regulation protein RsbU (phosphoserine phosphatase)
MPQNLFRYLVLAVLLAVAGWVRFSCAWNLFEILQNPAAAPTLPFGVATATRIIGTGPLRRDQILAIDGKPYHGEKQYEDLVAAHKPGDRITVTVSEPSGRAIERTIAIPGQQGNFVSADQWVLAIALSVLVPLICLLLGGFAVAIRPLDRNAWLLLLLLISFMELASRDYGTVSIFVTAWSSALSGLLPAFMMLFGIFFPEMSTSHRKVTWFKFLLVLPIAAVPLLSTGISVVWLYDINTALALRPLFLWAYSFQMIAGMAAIGSYFFDIGSKSRSAPSADSRRRLRILNAGSSVSLTPTLLLVLNALFRGHDIYDVPWFAVALSFAFLALFPLTLGYVIIVERAMDLRFVVRRSVQYGLARGGFWVARATLIVIAVYLLGAIGSQRSQASGAVKALEFSGLGFGLVALRRRTATQTSQWLDRRFFREAYDAERLLGELASEVGGFIEMEPLLQTVASRISGTLHVPDIVILLREGDVFVPRYTTRPGEPMNIAESGRIVKALRERGEAIEIHFDKPPLWIRSLSVQELQTLDVMRTQLLLPLMGRERLTGILSLGPKLSEAPYSQTDIRLLQAIGSQMSLGIENSRLVASLAAEAADRERANRELEIAREVQERLFPQNFPKVSGMDCAGHCRPARGVGGDYYDFLALEDGRIGIAIGDVSGKGIAAALLMASLQASLRGQAMAGLHDLAALMHNVNRLVYEASTSNRYATFFYGEFDPVTRRFTFVNAGHNAPVILRGGETLRLEAGGPVVGLLPGARYGQDECVLQPGDIFLAYTDGISEAMNEADEEWEEERFIAAARASADLPAKAMIRNIFHAADWFTGAAKQYDDMTLLVVKLAS